MIQWELRPEEAKDVLELLQSSAQPKYEPIALALKELLALEKLAKDSRWP